METYQDIQDHGNFLFFNFFFSNLSIDSDSVLIADRLLWAPKGLKPRSSGARALGTLSCSATAQAAQALVSCNFFVYGCGPSNLEVFFLFHTSITIGVILFQTLFQQSYCCGILGIASLWVLGDTASQQMSCLALQSFPVICQQWSLSLGCRKGVINVPIAAGHLVISCSLHLTSCRHYRQLLILFCAYF